MAKYIDVEGITRRIVYYYGHTNEGSGERYAYGVALKEIDRTPVADVVEVKHGEWLEIDSDVGWELVRCSLCGKEQSLFQDEEKPLYCPHCGAKMDGTPKERGGEK